MAESQLVCVGGPVCSGDLCAQNDNFFYPPWKVEKQSQPPLNLNSEPKENRNAAKHFAQCSKDPTSSALFAHASY